MFNSTAKNNLVEWFTSLHALQSASAAIDTPMGSLDLLKFANTKITEVLAGANAQGEFSLKVKESLGWDVTPGHIATFATFEALLDHFDSLMGCVSDYLQSLAVSPYPGGSSADFNKAKVSDAFPGGSKGSPWTNARALLASVVPAVCFSTDLQAAAGKIVDDTTQPVSELVKAIASLG